MIETVIVPREDTGSEDEPRRQAAGGRRREAVEKPGGPAERTAGKGGRGKTSRGYAASNKIDGRQIGSDTGADRNDDRSPGTLTVHVPLTFQRRSGRKTCIAPDGSLATVTALPNSNNALIRAVARAHRWQCLLEDGTHATIKDLAAAEAINPSYVGRMLRLTLLAPDIVEAILDGRITDLSAKAMVRSLPVEWRDQHVKLLHSS